MNEKEVAATTEDNPYNPFTEWENWLSFDVINGYYTCERLARIVKSVPQSLSDTENNYFVEEAIDDLIRQGAINKNGTFVKYKKVYKEN